MNVFINPRSIGTNHFESLKSDFPSVKFITDPSEAYLCEVIAVMPDFFKTQDISKFNNLKFAQLLMAGYDNFDFSPFVGRDIYVSNAVDIFSKSLSEDVITKILVLNRSVIHYVNNMKNGIWEPIRKEPELSGSVVGIIGAGSIGRETAKRLKAFESTVIGYRNKNEEVPYFDKIYTGLDGLKTVIEESDYLILAIPLTNDTFHLMNQERLSWMKKDALLINVARGSVVDQDALYDVLKEKKIRGAGLDVTTPEPLPKEHPLWQLDNVFITPHNASSSPYMQIRLKQLISHNLSKYLNNEVPDYIVFHKKGAK